ncbi:MAG: hypothetical protein E7270_02135 [Lachnospiraceae bacterium]|nr:hypothetical protein [Lachnospiraceae bacterium]
MQAGLDLAGFESDFQSLMDMYYQGQNLADMEVGASLNNEGFLQGLSDMVNAAGLTAAQATSLLSSMGVDAEVIETPVEAEDIAATSLTATPGTVSQNYTVPAAAGGTAQQTLTATFPTVTYSAEPIPSPIKKTAMALKVTSANKSSGGGFKHSKGGGGGGSGGGGGGGGKKKQKKDKIRPQDEIQRYHKNESTLT